MLFWAYQSFTGLAAASFTWSFAPSVSFLRLNNKIFGMKYYAFASFLFQLPISGFPLPSKVIFRQDALRSDLFVMEQDSLYLEEWWNTDGIQMR